MGRNRLCKTKKTLSVLGICTLEEKRGNTMSSKSTLYYDESHILTYLLSLLMREVTRFDPPFSVCPCRMYAENYTVGSGHK